MSEVRAIASILYEGSARVTGNPKKARTVSRDGNMTSLMQRGPVVRLSTWMRVRARVLFG
jgi:hypothetical protein